MQIAVANERDLNAATALSTELSVRERLSWTRKRRKFWEAALESAANLGKAPARRIVRTLREEVTHGPHEGARCWKTHGRK